MSKIPYDLPGYLVPFCPPSVCCSVPQHNLTQLLKYPGLTPTLQSNSDPAIKDSHEKLYSSSTPRHATSPETSTDSYACPRLPLNCFTPPQPCHWGHLLSVALALQKGTGSGAHTPSMSTAPSRMRPVTGQRLTKVPQGPSGGPHELHCWATLEGFPSAWSRGWGQSWKKVYIFLLDWFLALASLFWKNPGDR